jgi:hypothetical protein
MSNWESARAILRHHWSSSSLPSSSWRRAILELAHNDVQFLLDQFALIIAFGRSTIVRNRAPTA